MRTLKDRREGGRLAMCIVLSVSVYVLLIASIVGGLYVAIFAAAFAVSLGLMAGHLRGNGVRVSERQFPEAHAELVRLSQRLDMPVPEMYVLQAGGVLNAFATQFSTRRFVVVYSDLFEMALDGGRAGLSFVIAHELAHIKRRHLDWRPWIAPAMFVPLVGAAYSRACERTCDNYATWLCPEGVEPGLLALAAGRRLSKLMSGDAFVDQLPDGDFWFELAQAFADHPHLVHRVNDCVALRQELGAAAPMAVAESQPMPVV
ncbi:MAG: M48 family metallopeptidase [Candidatus Eisenbacteria bacterium]|nr:M48 family metallopeptidase [Candidatus Eisenbacteria bacterium]